MDLVLEQIGLGLIQKTIRLRQQQSIPALAGRE
jgi:hypothetical protein